MLWVFFFSFLFTQNGSLQSCCIFLYLFHFEVAGSQAKGHKKGNFSYRQEKFFFCFGLKLYEIPSELICFQNPEKSLQKAHVLNPIININNKLEAVCVYLLMFNVNAWEISAAQTYGFFSDECHLNESYWSFCFFFHTFRSLLLLLMAPLSISGCIKTMF